MKKIIALICAILLVLPLAACGKKDGAPEGMISAYIEGEPFKLYVPNQMKSNTESGISSAYANVPGRMMITARYYTPSEEMTLEEYLNFCAEGYADSLEEFEISSMTATVLAGNNAHRLIYTAKLHGADYTCTQIVTKHNGDFISLNFYVPSESAEASAEVVEMTVGAFELCDKGVGENDEVVDKKTPDGMKIASDNGIEYRLYVPKTWICKSDSGKSEAYYPESGRSNVTVTSFSPSGVITLDEYLSACKKEYEEGISGYTLVEETDATMAGREAKSIVFTSTYGGVEYKQRQVIILYGQMFYTFTYTAMADNYDIHSDDVEQMISAFTFR